MKKKKEMPEFVRQWDILDTIGAELTQHMDCIICSLLTAGAVMGVLTVCV